MVLISPADSKLISDLNKLGIGIIESECQQKLRKNEQLHADMQLLAINDTAFIPRNCISLHNKIRGFYKNVILCNEIKDPYPDNVGLNAALVGNKLLCKIESLEKKVYDYCKLNNIELINVNQGYAKCSTLVVNESSIITADSTIYKAAIHNGIRALRIRPGYIHLEDADYGFIGGCSGKIGDRIIFFGDIKKHPDYMAISGFIHDEGISYICTSKDMLNDIGGLVVLQ
ncbi:MAG: hypothetical protein IJC86_04030 [Clostridia bacterium]|nr:hypothetical protein [Clostridia bacterium]